jgi:hypothetical protein
MFRLNTAEAKAFAKKLEKIGKSTLGKATARTLTELATRANARQKINLDKRLIVRVTYTTKSLKMYPAGETKSIASQNSVVGSVSPYLEIHDKGGTIRGKRGRIPVPTSALRGADRRKKITPKMRMNALGDFGKKGGKFFKIGTGIYYRKSKRKIVRVRDISKRAYKIKGTRWHTDAARADATTSKISAIFARKARIIEQELGAK